MKALAGADSGAAGLDDDHGKVAEVVAAHRLGEWRKGLDEYQRAGDASKPVLARATTQALEGSEVRTRQRTEQMKAVGLQSTDRRKATTEIMRAQVLLFVPRDSTAFLIVSFSQSPDPRLLHPNLPPASSQCHP